MSIGDVRALIHSENREFIAQTKERFANFVGDGLDISLGIEVEVLPPENRERILASARVRPEVTFNCSRGRWTIAWHGLSGEIDLKSGEGEMGCDLSPVALNSFLRFACSLSLLKEAGFLVHAASNL